MRIRFVQIARNRSRQIKSSNRGWSSSNIISSNVSSKSKSEIVEIVSLVDAKLIDEIVEIVSLVSSGDGQRNNVILFPIFKTPTSTKVDQISEHATSVNRRK